MTKTRNYRGWIWPNIETIRLNMTNNCMYKDNNHQSKIVGINVIRKNPNQKDEPCI